MLPTQSILSSFASLSTWIKQLNYKINKLHQTKQMLYVPKHVA